MSKEEYSFERVMRKRPKCRFCGFSCRPLSTNAILGPGYREGNYVCKHCGKVQ